MTDIVGRSKSVKAPCALLAGMQNEGRTREKDSIHGYTRRSEAGLDIGILLTFSLLYAIATRLSPVKYSIGFFSRIRLWWIATSYTNFSPRVIQPPNRCRRPGANFQGFCIAGAQQP